MMMTGDFESDRRNLRAGIVAFAIMFGTLYWMGGAQAQGLNVILGVIDAQGKSWMTGLAEAGRTTFMALATIEITWCAALWAFEKDNMTSMMGDMVKAIMTISFFYALMVNAPEWIGIIHEQFKHASAETLKVTALTPDGVLMEGFMASQYVRMNMMNPAVLFAGMASQIISLIEQVVVLFITAGAAAAANPQAGADMLTTLATIGTTLLWGLMGFGFANLVSLCVLICYFIIALQLVMLQIEMILLMAAGAIFLGLGGSRWTREYVQTYMKHALTTGLRYLVLMMVLSFTMAGMDANPFDAAANSWKTLLTEGGSAEMNVAMSSFGILFLVLTKTFLAIKAPELASALMTGGSALTANSVADTVMTGVNAAATVVGMPAAGVGAAEAMGTISRGELGATFAGKFKQGGGDSGSKHPDGVKGLGK